MPNALPMPDATPSLPSRDRHGAVAASVAVHPSTHRLLALLAATLGCAAAIGTLDPSKLATEIDEERDHISAIDLADRIKRSDSALKIFDLRSTQDFDNFHIPTAHQISIAALTKAALPRDADIVLYSQGGTHAAQAWVLVRMRGYRRVFVLREGIDEWNARVFEPRLAIDATQKERVEFNHAAVLSRYFGGTPVSDVPRAQVPAGYWTSGSGNSAAAAPTPTGPIRRRGC